MKKNVSKVLLSAFSLLIIFTLIGSINVAAGGPPDQTIEVQGDTIQTQLQSNERTKFCFRERTSLTICSNVGLELDINCEALKIGEKDVAIEVEGDGNLKMTMTCTREETQFSLMNGSLNRVRNRNSYRYLEGICITMEDTANCKCECKCDPACTCVCECECKCNPECTCPCDCQCKCESECSCECDCQCKCESECSCECDCQCKCDPVCDCDCDCQCKCEEECQCNSECSYDGAFLKARLKIRKTNQNQLAQWAYYDNENEEWVVIPTITEDGYLTSETNVLSTWTLLVPEITTSAIVGTVAIASVSALGILALSVFYLKKRH
ncbi:MAG: hypothetical protein HWN80_17865 [Candidatus Lokiarchaeota archaeon]|nr:hypothetical protein [Candidatus Lokiarchaeota archaeon]